jgi:NADH-ubiquinone oxidoreductase chain 6
MKTFFINLLALGTLISSVTSITSKNPVISVIHLIATFVFAAGFLILIGINFVGICNNDDKCAPLCLLYS